MKQRLEFWVLSPCWWSFHCYQSLDPGIPKKPDSATCLQTWILIPNTQWTVTARDGEKQRKKVSSVCPHWEEQMKMSNWWVLWRLLAGEFKDVRECRQPVTTSANLGLWVHCLIHKEGLTDKAPAHQTQWKQVYWEKIRARTEEEWKREIDSYV